VLIEADAAAYGPGDVAAAIAEVVRAHQAAGNTYDLILTGNDAADTGDFQVPIRLAYALDRPVLTGISKVSVAGGVATAQGDGPSGTEEFEVPLPAVIAVLEGGVEPRYPSIPGRMKAKKAPVERVTPSSTPTGSGRMSMALPPPQPSVVEKLGEGAPAAPAVVDLLEKLGVLR
jgi:electron transfer flavoprotein beta subunit